LTFKSAPDANVAADVKLDTNEHQFILFLDSGTYTITCLQFPNQPIKVKVLANGG
jgi:hypothetical protein